MAEPDPSTQNNVGIDSTGYYVLKG